MRISAMLVVGVLAGLHAVPAEARMPCQVAFQRIDAYYWQVKAFADTEAYRDIPMRCGPDIICGNWWIGRLNRWFATQVQMINRWQADARQRCLRPPSPKVPENPPPDIGRTVQIEIPITPQGYRP